MFKTNLIGDTILFLDIDGPLLPARLHFCPPNKNLASKLQHLDVILDEAVMAVIRDIIQECSAKIVISSKWTQWVAISDIKALFGKYGVKFEHCLHPDWKTLQAANLDRGQQIALWLREHENKIKNYLILDDDTSVTLNQTIDPEKIVLADYYNGLSFQQLIQMYQILGLDIPKFLN